MEVGTKLSKNDVGDLVDSTYFKQIRALMIMVCFMLQLTSVLL